MIFLLGGCHILADAEIRGLANELAHTYAYIYIFNSLQDEIFQKFSYDTEWAVKLISRINNNEELPIEGSVIVKQVQVLTFFFYFL